MKPISRIVCAVDIDDQARTAPEQALAIARARNAKLELVCAVPPDEPFNQRATDRISYLQRIRRDADAAGVEVYSAVQVGEHAEILLLHAEARAADLIVIALSHGRGGGRTFGSVAETVLRAAPCPTLIVPPGAPNVASFTNVLAAVDLTPSPDVPLAAVRPLLSANEHRLTVLHVVKGGGAQAAALQTLQSTLPDPSPRTFARVTVGEVQAEVLQAARSLQADLIVIGARRRTRVGRRLFGVTRTLLAAAPCPVLAVPVRPAAAGGERRAA